MKDTSRLTAAETNQRYNKSANVAARKLLLLNCSDRHVFGDLKVLHAAISYQVFEGHNVDFTGCGHPSLALQRRSSVVSVEGVDDRHCRQWVVDCVSGV